MTNATSKCSLSTSNTGKAFAAKQKICTLKSRMLKLKAILDKSKATTPPTAIIKQSDKNMNDVKKYAIKLLTKKKMVKNFR